MADIGDISAILGLLGSSSPEGGEGQAEETGESGGLGGIDADMLIKLMEVFSSLNESDKNTDLILALKPHLRAENRPKADRAAELVKLMSVLSVLGDSGIFQ